MERRILGLRLRQIDAEGSFCPRLDVSEEIAEEYADWIKDDDREPPPIIVFGRREPYYVGDGFTRYRAHELAGRKTIMADVRPGGWREAAMFAITANLDNGERPTIEDRKHCARMLLLDPQWGKELSHRDIATLCRIGHTTVDVIAKALKQGEEPGRDRDGLPRAGQLYDCLTSASRWIAQRNKKFDALPLTLAERAAIDQATAELGAVWAPILARLTGTTPARKDHS